jgi:hypothetical protein
MGTKYGSGVSASGYNSSPPSDDGTASESNKVKWSTVKTKLSDPVKTLTEAVNTALVTALDQSARSVSASDSAAATDHDRVIQVTTASVIITLADAATMGAGYRVRVSNQSSGTITTALATSGNTINGVTNTTEKIQPKQTALYIVNSATSGYLSEKSLDGGFTSVQVYTTTGANTWTKPAGLKRVRVTVVGGGGAGGGSGATGGADTSCGGGGGGGGTAIKVIAAASLGDTETATVGAGGTGVSAGTGNTGGTSSFGAHCSATGGSGGGSGAVGSTTYSGAGDGGAGSGGDVNIIGSGGSCGVGTNTGSISGSGGASSIGGGGRGQPAHSGTGIAGKAYGGGGSGSAVGSSQSANTGGAGAAGIIIVEEFF